MVLLTEVRWARALLSILLDGERGTWVGAVGRTEAKASAWNDDDVIMTHAQQQSASPARKGANISDYLASMSRGLHEYVEGGVRHLRTAGKNVVEQRVTSEREDVRISKRRTSVSQDKREVLSPPMERDTLPRCSAAQDIGIRPPWLTPPFA